MSNNVVIDSRQWTRRGFLAASAAGAAAAGLFSLTGCAPKGQAEEGLAQTGEAMPIDEGMWIAAACWDNCGGR